MKNLFGTDNLVRNSEKFEIVKFGLTIYIFIEIRREKIGTQKKVRNNGEFGLTGFGITVFYCSKIRHKFLA